MASRYGSRRDKSRNRGRKSTISRQKPSRSRTGGRGMKTTAPRRGARTTAPSRSRARVGRPGIGNVAAVNSGMNGPGSIFRTYDRMTDDGLWIQDKLVTPKTWIDTAKIYNQMLENSGFGPNRFGYVDFRGHFTPGHLKHNGALGSGNQEH